MTNKQAYAGLLEHVIGVRDYRRRTFSDMEVEGDGVDTALTQAAEAISSLLKRVGELEGALIGEQSLVQNAQGILTEYLFPDGISADEAINQLIGLLDGPRQLEVLATSTAALNSDAPNTIGDGM